MEKNLDSLHIHQVVRHYKGGLYRVHDKVLLESNCEPSVVYTELDPAKKAQKWTRPESDFFAILKEGEETTRFTPYPWQSAEGLRAYLPEYMLPFEVVERVLRQYDAPDRFYHNRQHVLALYNRANEMGLALSPEQALAILFHDAVYAPGAAKGQNEQMSVNFMRRFYPLFGSQMRVDTSLLESIIMDTVDHVPTSAQSEVVLNLDLMSLAGDFEDFKTTWELIRLEYANVVQDPKEFDKGRLRVLLTMCQRDKLFYSSAFEGEVEAQARSNIEKMRQLWVASTTSNAA